MKRLFCLLFTALILIMAGASVYADDSGIMRFRVNPYGGASTDMDSVSWEKLQDGYYLFLPADTDRSKAKVWAASTKAVLFDGKRLSWGQKAEAFTPGRHTVTCGDSTVDLTVCYSEEIPSVYIQTETGSLRRIHANKEYKEPAAIRIYENGELTMDSELKQIKGRGNATWDFAKKGYNIKFDKKTDMFGMGAAKKWALLANYLDQSLVHNTYGWEYSKAFGLPFTSDYKHIDLYVNGSYLGNYVICESVEIGKARIKINDLEEDNEKANPGVDLETLPQRGNPLGLVNGSAKWIDIPVSPEDISGGYLLEFEFPIRYKDEKCGFVADNGQYVVLKEPELASRDEVQYIQSFVNDMLKAVNSRTGRNSKGKHYSEYVDMDSLVNMYILQELSANLDAGKSSFFAYKDKKKDKLVFAPVWDLDQAFGSAHTVGAAHSGDPTTWWANSIGYLKYSDINIDVLLSSPTILSSVYRHTNFRDAVNKRWAELRGDASVNSVRSDVHDLSEKLRASAVMNLVRWGYVTGLSEAESRYSQLTGTGENYIDRRLETLTKGFSKNNAMLYYDPNGGKGCIFSPYVVSIGGTVRILGPDQGDQCIESPCSRDGFAGWNTRADGEGTTYMPGDPITLTDRTTVLYAIWKDKDKITENIDTQYAPKEPIVSDAPGEAPAPAPDSLHGPLGSRSVNTSGKSAASMSASDEHDDKQAAYTKAALSGKSASTKAARLPKLSRKSITVQKGKTKTVRIINKTPGAYNKYKNTKKAKIVSGKSAKTIRIKGLKKGKTTLKIKVGSTWLKLKVRVK